MATISILKNMKAPKNSGKKIKEAFDAKPIKEKIQPSGEKIKGLDY